MKLETRPVCEQCWGHTARAPTRVNVRELEECAFCGRKTLSGIYVRVDPRYVIDQAAEMKRNER